MKLNITRPIRYLTISDLHLGHSLVPIITMVAGFMQYFVTNHNKFKELDIIFIAGDTFDKLLTTNGDDYNIAVKWLLWLLRYCNKNKIKLRILEGTPGHDWNQSKLIKTINDDNDLDVDFKYIEALSIEKMDDIDLTILYVPDEWNNDASDTFDEVQVLLKEHNLDKVDIAIMHGAFDYQIPIASKAFHNSKMYLDIVKAHINIGHVHSFSTFKRIIAQGSTDRLVHGEEEAKGGVVVTLRPDGNNEMEFIENENATIFKTFNVATDDISVLLDEVKPVIAKLPNNSHIRFMFEKDNLLRSSGRELKDFFNKMVVKVDYKDDKKKDVVEKIDVDLVDVSFNITSKNIAELLLSRLDKYNLTAEETLLSTEELLNVS